MRQAEHTSDVSNQHLGRCQALAAIYSILRWLAQTFHFRSAVVGFRAGVKGAAGWRGWRMCLVVQDVYGWDACGAQSTAESPAPRIREQSSQTAKRKQSFRTPKVSSSFSKSPRRKPRAVAAEILRPSADGLRMTAHTRQAPACMRQPANLAGWLASGLTSDPRRGPRLGR